MNHSTLHSTMFLLKHVRSGLKTELCTALHSTMFLLKPISYFDTFVIACFTFHNVSIKTIPQINSTVAFCCFTFHNVSIKTILIRDTKKSRSDFTFHNVSIKTGSLPQSGISFRPLYIPQCFY